jgi:indolepyruvate ferredoxin oxidoreductase alpha subunit
VHPLKRRALAKLSSFAQYADFSAANRLDDNGNRERGIVTAGLPYLSVLDALEEAQRKPDILKLGVVHPLPRGLLRWRATP